MAFENPLTEPLDLKRYPLRKQDALQAWDAADALILEHLNQTYVPTQAPSRVLVLQDGFGALTCPLSTVPHLELTTYSDSYVSHQGIDHNLQTLATNLTTQVCSPERIHDLQTLTGAYDLVLLKLPKSMSFLEDILATLTHHMHAESVLIVGGMVKHMARASFELIERYIGQTHTSLAKKKARLIFASFEREPVQTPYPIMVQLDGFAQPFEHHSNIFSRHKLDVGTRFLLAHMPTCPGAQDILDLGCANGILAIKTHETHPTATLHVSDDSYMAIKSARANLKTHRDVDAQTYWTNCFEHQPEASVDLVLCNPPFHQNHTVGRFIAEQMFRDAHHSLRPGGLLRIVGNHHLRYHQSLKRRFGHSQIVAKNKKFMIVDAIKR